MAKMLVCYYSQTGHTAGMAGAIAEGAKGVSSVTVDVKPVAEVKAKDLLDYDAIVIGSPTYYGAMAWQIKQLLDESVAFHGKLSGKVAGAFTSSGNIAGGAETTLLAILEALLIHGMVCQGTPKGGHYGPAAVGKMDDRARGECRAHGKLLAELAAKLHG